MTTGHQEGKWPVVRRLPGRDVDRFSVASRTGPARYEVLIDAQVEEGYSCTCDRFTRNTHYHGQACHHIKSALRFMLSHDNPSPQ